MLEILDDHFFFFMRTEAHGVGESVVVREKQPRLTRLDWIRLDWSLENVTRDGKVARRTRNSEMALLKSPTGIARTFILCWCRYFWKWWCGCGQCFCVDVDGFENQWFYVNVADLKNIQNHITNHTRTMDLSLWIKDWREICFHHHSNSHHSVNKLFLHLPMKICSFVCLFGTIDFSVETTTNWCDILALPHHSYWS